VALAGIAARLPVGLVASGPAAGVIGATRLAALSGDLDILTFDMGGTTADVALVMGGEPQFRFRGEAMGHPLILPQVDVLSVGAGSGSIARVDRFGSLSVGPESAGADPGPVAYGRGGRHPTVTDAHIALGTLDPRSFLGGSIQLDAEGARAAIQGQVGAPLGLSTEQAAAAILRVANATMVRALRVISVARGQDPRRFSLSAFGGAGPLHACAIAEELGIRRVLVPRHPGVTSALGLLLADVRHDLRQSWVRVTSRIEPGELRRRLAAMEVQAQELLGSSGLSDGDGRIETAVDMRYRGQAYELTVPLRRGNTARSLAKLDRDFHNAHRQAYGHARPVDETELVTLRVRAVGPVSTVVEVRNQAGASRGPGAPGRRQAWLEGEPVDCAVYDRAGLPVGAHLSGPAILEQYDSTVLVAPGWRLRVGAAGNAVLERE
jgi:N-methylhydantoinase A